MDFVTSSYNQLRTVVEKTPSDALPPNEAIVKAVESLPSSLPSHGLGEQATQTHLLTDIVPGFNGPKTGSNYYGFVTGGVLPIAEVADNIVTAFDQNVQVHLPTQSISTFVEDKALSLTAELVHLPDGFRGRTFTTGATGANILGLACARESVLNARLQAAGDRGEVAELGLLSACLKAGVKEIQVLSSMGHSSLYKAASIIGLGRSSVKDLPYSKDEPWRIDFVALESHLQRAKEGVVSIVAISAGEVNTGRFATDGLSQNGRIRDLCDKYDAWFHVDAAFGLFARSLPPTPEFQSLILSSSGLELADSIAGDCHKMLNVPYDCGIFFTSHPAILTAVFQNANAAYLSTGPAAIPSPLNNGMENSRRLRALPVYAVLLAHGRDGLAQIFAKQVRLARAVSAFIDTHPSYELLAQTPSPAPPSHPSYYHHLSLTSPQPTGTNTPIERPPYEDTHVVVIFRAKDERVNRRLVESINGGRKIYVSGTQWQGRKACRIAISTWKVDVGRDLELMRRVLGEVVKV
ncbi:pyridoxal phosphate-dependent transferase [Amylocarpus encephaloides]|uniref:Pyridoxal phosphate-dependent transferase n=1 Tax=Amylocarpus encephaloides TaxID=45428 RepID=A0A9P7YTQ0_9HELO|nr:pyridoxal phosphate-dependent transferase [Amylocarpus encephaloides]